MSNYYTEKIKPFIIELLEEGVSSIRDISDICNVSISFVRSVIEEYEWFYVNVLEQTKKRVKNVKYKGKMPKMP